MSAADPRAEALLSTRDGRRAFVALALLTARPMSVREVGEQLGGITRQAVTRALHVARAAGFEREVDALKGRNGSRKGRAGRPRKASPIVRLRLQGVPDEQLDAETGEPRA